MRVLLVDDVALARQKLARALGAHADVQIVGEAANGEEMAAAVAEFRPELVFLDISMPEQDGFSALAEVPVEHRPLVIFLTAYAQYALDAFRVEAVDYLLKPVDPQALAQSLQRVRRRLAEPSPSPGTQTPTVVHYAERLTLRTDTGLRVMPVESVRWIEAIRNYTAFHCAQETLIVRATLQGVLDTLDPARFVRVHRSAIVNVAEVHELRPQGNGDQRMLLKDGTRIGISRTYRDALMRLLAR
jgi:two-component system, LytTR family, response regulator